MSHDVRYENAFFEEVPRLPSCADWRSREHPRTSRGPVQIPTPAGTSVMVEADGRYRCDWTAAFRAGIAFGNPRDSERSNRVAAASRTRMVAPFATVRRQSPHVSRAAVPRLS